MLLVFFRRWFRADFAILRLLFILLGMSRCAADYPATYVDPYISSGSSTPVSSTRSIPSTPPAAPPAPSPPVDAVSLKAPRISPDGGTFHVSTEVKLTADTLPTGGVIEYSLDQGQTWQAGQQFTLISGGQVMARLHFGNKVSPSQTASFRLYFKRMLIIGNSIMSSPPIPDKGWFNSNGMAASAPEKDFVHLLTADMETLYKPLQVKLQDGGDFELKFGAADYRMDEFDPVLRDFKPDLIVVRIGENMDDSRVQPYHLESQFRILLERLASTNQPFKIICTTSVWYRPKADAVIRKVTTEKGYSLVDLSRMVGQGQYFASEYKVPIIAAHPSDAGMQRIADSIWEKIQ